MTSGQERRSSPRIAERLTLAVTDGGNVIEAETKNISVSGVYCNVSRFIAPMTKLQVQFEVPNGSRKASIRCTGVVVRAEPAVTSGGEGRFHIAVFFSDLSSRNREAIAQFVRQRLAASAAH